MYVSAGLKPLKPDAVPLIIYEVDVAGSGDRKKQILDMWMPLGSSD